MVLIPVDDANFRKKTKSNKAYFFLLPLSAFFSSMYSITVNFIPGQHIKAKLSVSLIRL